MDLNIRNVPEELVKDLKKAALEDGSSLRDYCIRVLGSEPYLTAKPTIMANEFGHVGPIAGITRTSRPELYHDKKSCKVYGCLMCRAAE